MFFKVQGFFLKKINKKMHSKLHFIKSDYKKNEISTFKLKLKIWYGSYKTSFYRTLK